MKGDLLKAFPTAQQLDAYRKACGLSPQTFSDKCVARAYLMRMMHYDKYSAEKIIREKYANQVQ